MSFRDYLIESASNRIPNELSDVISYIKTILNIKNIRDVDLTKYITFHKFGSGSSVLMIKLPSGDKRKKQITIG